MRKNAIIILGGSIYDLPFITELKKRNYYIFIVDIDINAPGLEYADYPVNLSIKDIESLIRFFKQKKEKYNFIAVTSVDTEANRAVAALCSLFEISSFNFEISDIVSNKFKLYNFLKSKKEFLNKIKVKCIDSFVSWYYENLIDLIEKKIIMPPFVLKPTENSGSIGTVIVNSLEDMYQNENIIENKTDESIGYKNGLKMLFLYSKNFSPTGEVIIQKMLDGEIFKVVYLVGKNIIQPIFVWNINYNKNKYSYEFNRTNKIEFNILKYLLNIGKKIIIGLGFKNCPIEIKFIKQNNTYYLLDINIRLEGGFFIDKVISNYLEYDIIENYLKIVMGLDPNNFDYIEFLKNNKNRYIHIKKIYDYKRIEKNNLSKNISVYEIPEKYLKTNIISSKYYSQIIYTFSEKFYDFSEVKVKKIKDSKNYERNLLKLAKINLNGTCNVCRVCDGKGCIGQIPGMGGKFNNEIFTKNYYDLRNLKIDSSFFTYNQYINRLKLYKKLFATKGFINLFGKNLRFPLMVAPITGVNSNLGGKLNEEKFYLSLIKGAIESDSLAFLGDGSSNEKYLYMAKILKKVKYNAIITLKPRQIEKMKEKIIFFNNTDINAIAIDIDSFTLPTVNKEEDDVVKYSIKDLIEIKKTCSKPLIIKGVMNYYDMLKIAKYKFDSFIISNHGGRVNTSLKSTIEVLQEIDIKFIKKINPEIKIGIDGGFRNGEDIVKALLFGADYVLIGRPFAIYAAGDGVNGVKFLFEKYLKEINEFIKYLST